MTTNWSSENAQIKPDITEDEIKHNQGDRPPSNLS